METPTPARVAGIILAIAAALTFVAVGLYFVSGAVADDPGDPVAAGTAIAEASGALAVSAYVSIAANALFAIAALMLATATPAPSRRIALPGLWMTLAVATLLILPFDLALPRGLIPLAQEDPTSVTFAALYETINLVHSVGLVLFYVGTSALFVHQAHTARLRGHRIGWRIATGISVLAMVVAVGLVLERPPVFLVPAVFLTWLGILWLGIRMAGRESSQVAGAAALA